MGYEHIKYGFIFFVKKAMLWSDSDDPSRTAILTLSQAGKKLEAACLVQAVGEGTLTLAALPGRQPESALTSGNASLARSGENACLGIAGVYESVEELEEQLPW